MLSKVPEQRRTVLLMNFFLKYTDIEIEKEYRSIEVIENTVAREPEAIDKVLYHYVGYIKYLSTYRGYINDNI